ncbi:hypothetical protein NLI96_g7656 [Meripilus lineatus]|uniref:F-box domain-containing protein n=1 Tax=Meripilus lineatus TaxID=2056292 RepID=A0AAD5YEP9_9APHY|nr:hypothetical protein NLI96_g7656 [Physisporinus lineatus]
MQDIKSFLVPISSNPEEGRQYNAKLPSSRLPPEIWGDIMCMYRDMCSGLELDSRILGLLPPFLWIAVAQVCHRWRETALGHPALWSHVVLQATTQQLDNPLRRSMISELFHRSGKCPMTFVGRGVFKGFDVIEVSLIVENIHRFRYVSMAIESQTVLELPPFPSAPLLEVFHFDLHYWTPTRRILPPVFSDSDFPEIQNIEFLRSSFSNINPFLRSTLTRISIFSCVLNAPDCSAFLSSLQAMSGLRELLLTSIVVPEFDPHILPRDLQLSALRFLEIVTTDDSSIMRLVSRISIPHNTRTHFHFRSDPPRYQFRWDEFERFIHEIRDFLTSNVFGGLPTFRSIRLQALVASELLAWHDELPEEPRLGVGDGDPDPDFRVRVKAVVARKGSLLRLLCGSLPQSAVRTGFIATKYSTLRMSSLWHGLLNTMNEIRHLQLSISRPVYFCRALSKRSEAQPTLLLPKLERLILYRARFLHSQHPFRSTTFQQIKSWLRLRAERGYKIPTLEFRKAVNFHEGDLDTLRDCADVVVWDYEEIILLDDPPHAIPAALSTDNLEPQLLMD